MTDFFEEGFLCTEIEKLTKLCYEEHMDYFSLCERVNRYYFQLIPKLRFQNNNRQAALTDALFIRQVALFEGVIILSSKGMVREAKVLLRTLIENMFTLVAITKSMENADLYYNYNYFTKVKVLKFQRKFNAEIFNQRGLDKTLGELEEKVKSLQIKEVGIFDWARKAELSDYYKTVYPYLSWTVHSNVLDAAKLLKGKSDRDIRAVEWRPEIDEVAIALATAIECSYIGTNSVIQMFKLGLEHELESFLVENKAIADKIKLT